MTTPKPSVAQREPMVLGIFKRHVNAFTSGDLDAVLRDFGENSVVITPDGVFAGLDRIRALYSSLLAEFGAIDRGESPGLFIDQMHVHDDTLFITWHAESRHHVFPFGTDTFLARDDSGVCQTICHSPLQARI